jgi:hypothetical protein
MADKNSLLEFVAQELGPEQLQQIVDQVEQELGQDPEVMNEGVEGLQELVEQLSFVAENPEMYADVMNDAVQKGVLDAEDVPEEFDPVFIGIIILALEELIARMSSTQQFAKGGLAKAAKHLASKGRYGDTMLAHINPREAQVLRRMGGSGTINPETGLPEFFIKRAFRAVKRAFKAVAKVIKPIAKAVLPVLATKFLGPWGGAAVGALTGSMDGGGIKGAILGGLSGGLAPGGGLSSTASKVGAGLTSMLPAKVGNFVAQNISPGTLGSTVLGGLGSTALGRGFLPGAIMAGGMAAATPGIKSLTNKAMNYFSGPGGMFSSQAGGTGINFAPDAQTSFSGVPETSGIPDFSIASGPSTTPGIKLPSFDTGAAIKDSTGSLLTNISNTAAANAGNVAGAAPSTGLFGTGISAGDALTGLGMLNALGGMSVPQAQQTIQGSELSPEQKAAMNRELTNYTANLNMVTLPQQGTPEHAEMMDRIQRGISINFMNPTITPTNQLPTTNMARGGALSRVAMLAEGTGDGRSDTINARLSDGEYVIDAETVALLGNGSTKAGASALDMMRKQLRKQKGKNLAKGKFSPDAKSPLAYMRGGLR